MSASQVMEMLTEENRRFVRGKRTALCGGTGEEPAKLVQTRTPKAAVLSSSDSRVSPHHVLDHEG